MCSLFASTTQPMPGSFMNVGLLAVKLKFPCAIETGGTVNGKLILACLPPPVCKTASPFKCTLSQGTKISMPLYRALNCPLNAVALIEAKLTEPAPNVAVKGPVERVPQRPLVMPQLVTTG